jgi:hypothetical protein
MDWKETLKDASLFASGVLAVVYVCGWQFYLALLHSLHTDMHFFVPPENALGAGVEPFCTVLLAVGAPGILFAWGARVMTSTPRLKVPMGLAAAVVGGALPLVVVWWTRPWNPITLSVQEWLTLGVFGALLAGVVYVVTLRFASITKPHVYLAYAFLFLLFVVVAIEYAKIRGNRAALGNGSRSRVQLTVSDSTLRERLGMSWFIPILETRDDLLLLRFRDGDRANGNLLLIKKAQIQAMEYADYPQ